jgi:hypothetical protein
MNIEEMIKNNRARYLESLSDKEAQHLPLVDQQRRAQRLNRVVDNCQITPQES